MGENGAKITAVTERPSVTSFVLNQATLSYGLNQIWKIKLF